jgi:hypothetical protein
MRVQVDMMYHFHTWKIRNVLVLSNSVFLLKELFLLRNINSNFYIVMNKCQIIIKLNLLCNYNKFNN